jgi:Spy/CpxP family protein refolding chaperone
MKVVSVVLALAVSWLMVGNVLAGPAKSPVTKSPAKSQSACAEQMHGFEGLSQLNLTAAQQAKITDLKKEYGPKFKEVRQSKEAVLTPAQKQARENVMSAAKAAKAAGKKPADTHKAITEAVKLSKDQQAKMAKLDKSATELRADVHKKILAILTPQQAAEWTKAGTSKCQPAKKEASQPMATKH